MLFEWWAECSLNVWVKVRGHSKAVDGGAKLPSASLATVRGNHWADKAAEYGAEGTKPPRCVCDIAGYIRHHLHRQVDLDEWQARRAESTRTVDE